MLDFDLNKECYGCSACYSICPKSAIEMVENLEGFLVPNIDYRKCIECGLCDKVCIKLNPNKNKSNIYKSDCYSSYIKNEEEIMKSTSGGIFYKLACEMLNQQGFVAGCIWDENMEAKHIISNNLEDIKKMRGSKYVQSRIDNCYIDIKNELKNNKKILFTGTPCQVAGLLNIVGENENLYTCSLICGGVPSPKIWRMYKKKVENEQNSKLINIDFRKKGRYGWESPFTHYEFKNNKSKEILSFHLDTYITNYLYGIYKRNSCYNCQYKGSNDVSDIIIGDYWGISKDLMKASENKGISAVIINTSKGKEIFDYIKKYIHYKEADINHIIIKNKPLIEPVYRKEIRDKFLNEIENMSFDEAINKYGSKNKKKKCFWLLDKLGLFEVAKNIIK